MTGTGEKLVRRMDMDEKLPMREVSMKNNSLIKVPDQANDKIQRSESTDIDMKRHFLREVYMRFMLCIDKRKRKKYISIIFQSIQSSCVIHRLS